MEEWKTRFYTDGIKAGEIDGQSDEKPVILVQCKPFPMGNYEFKPITHMIVVEFLKDADKAYLDLDEGNELVEEGIISEDAKDYRELADDFDTEHYTMYGSYVEEILPEEIVAIHYAISDERKATFIMDGKKY